ncbi:hypothetical protein BTH42_14855 [Burkholderia sp. SRS-W-2-2016]|uniref:tetratricopeptide repeat protein n=1 Tax=Burkholderia sp. SRS-W-2-2016 TaxID=1926878 RepID=UPI00094B003F|nr:tetratricopeptide repeat protein [Burkholderia sp. SRS-W-2-2016]OLL30853.1 hypothetical protein BTH42_14855 [Burkholderia sp. SRS-W-2-2016]
MNTPPIHAKDSPPDRLERLLGYLDSDPTNVTLLGDAAACAFDAQRFDLCDELLIRQQARGTSTPASMNLYGLCAMARGKFDEALRAFAALPDHDRNPVIRYNKAYAHAMLSQFDEATGLLDEDVWTAVPQAIALRMRALHHLGRLDEVIELGKRYADHPEAGPEICGLLATALFDSEDVAGAAQFASRAMSLPDGLAVNGLLALNEGSSTEALALFSRALAIRPDNSRALLGTGLALLEQHRFEEAAQQIDTAALAFRSHAGSWVAAGWAYLLKGDLVQARARFEQGGSVDRGFAEVPGALAIVALKEGRLDDARAQTKIALRLDPGCLSAALAQALIEVQAGNQANANTLLDTALKRPIDAQGNTIERALSRKFSQMGKSFR